LSADALQDFLGGVQAVVYKRQKGMAKDLRGHYVNRNGITFRVIQVTAGTVVVSGTGVDDKSFVRMSTRSFLSKKVIVVDKPEKI